MNESIAPGAPAQATDAAAAPAAQAPAAPAADPNAAAAAAIPPAAQPEPGTPAAQQQAADDAVKAAEGEPWYQAMPEDTHESLKGFATAEEAAAAIAAGQQFTQAKTVDDYSFTFAEGVDGSAPEITEFKQFCLDQKIAPKQAQELLNYQTGVLSKANDAARQQGEATLRAEWGNAYDVNMGKALGALTAIDRQLGEGNQLATELKASGGGNRPAIVKALLWVSEKIGEDSLGAGGPGGAPETAISTEAAYDQMFKGK